MGGEEADDGPCLPCSRCSQEALSLQRPCTSPHGPGPGPSAASPIPWNAPLSPPVIHHPWLVLISKRAYSSPSGKKLLDPSTLMENGLSLPVMFLSEFLAVTRLRNRT